MYALKKYSKKKSHTLGHIKSDNISCILFQCGTKGKLNIGNQA